MPTHALLPPQSKLKRTEQWAHWYLVDPADDFIEKDRCANLPPPTVDWIQLSADEATDGGTQQISRC